MGKRHPLGCAEGLRRKAGLRLVGGLSPHPTATIGCDRIGHRSVNSDSRETVCRTAERALRLSLYNDPNAVPFHPYGGLPSAFSCDSWRRRPSPPPPMP